MMQCAKCIFHITKQMWGRDMKGDDEEENKVKIGVPDAAIFQTSQ